MKKKEKCTTGYVKAWATSGLENRGGAACGSCKTTFPHWQQTRTDKALLYPWIGPAPTLRTWFSLGLDQQDKTREPCSRVPDQDRIWHLKLQSSWGKEATIYPVTKQYMTAVLTKHPLGSFKILHLGHTSDQWTQNPRAGAQASWCLWISQVIEISSWV
jgi:hypothetical protein